MNQTDFIEGIKLAVEKSANDSVLSNLIQPPGRQPSESLKELSTWYNSLNSKDQEMIIKLIHESVDTAVFGFLCVIDGVRTIEKSGDKGQLNLYYSQGEVDVLLNDPKEDYLHEQW